MTRTRTLLTALLCLALFGCGADTAEGSARDAFARFKSAVRNSDREALRELLTAESFPAIDDVLAHASSNEPACVIDETRTRGTGRVDLVLADPDSSERRGVYVLVREGGAWRIDLVESAIASHGASKGAGFDVRPGADPAAVQEAVIRREAGTR